MKKALLLSIVAASAAAILVACGGSSGDGAAAVTTTTTTTTVPATTIISGSAVKGPVANAIVTIKNASTNAVLAATTTNATGDYSVNVAYTGDVIIEITGGTYLDEATNVTTTLSAPMRVVLTVSGTAVTGVVTPLTTMAYTNAFGTGSGAVTAAAFNTAAANLATQFKLTGVNLVTTAPAVSGTVNTYGQVLRAFSQYVQTQNVTLTSVINTQFTTQQLAAFNTAFNTAYAAINPGSTVTFSFDGSGFNISGTGVGGGTGTCGINATGNVTVQNISVPLNLNFCVTGIAAGSCTAGNTSLSQALAGQSGISGAVNLNYTYSSTCAAGATNINLQ